MWRKYFVNCHQHFTKNGCSTIQCKFYRSRIRGLNKSCSDVLWNRDQLKTLGIFNENEYGWVSITSVYNELNIYYGYIPHLNWPFKFSNSYGRKSDTNLCKNSVKNSTNKFVLGKDKKWTATHQAIFFSCMFALWYT